MADITRSAQIIFSADTNQAKGQINELVNSLRNIQSMPTNIINVDNIRQASTAAVELENHLRAATNVQTGKLDLSRFAASLSSANTSLDQYIAKLSRAGTAGNTAFKNLANTINQSAIATTRLSTGMNNFLTTMKNTIKWNISSGIMNGLVNGMQTALSYAQSLDKSLTNIRIVTGQSQEQMARFAEEANKSAQQLNTTTKKYTDAALIFYQQGLGDDAVKARTDAVIKMANVTGDAAKEVSSYMTAIWNNFDDGTASLTSFEDKIVALGATTASSSAEIAAGIEKFAAAGHTVGLSFDYAASALATVVAETRQSADTVGTSFRTLFTRLQGLKLGETLDDGTTLNKYSAALATVGVQIKDASGQLREMDDILDDLGSRWQTLSKDTQVALAQTVGGARQYTTLLSLMDNWDKFQNNLATTVNSEGTLQKQADIYAQSWEAAKNRVTTAAQGIYDAIIDQNAFIKFNNIIAETLKGVEGLIKGLGGMPGILTMIGAAFTQHIAKNVPTMLSNLTQNLAVLTGKANSQALGIQQNLTQQLANKQAKATSLTEQTEYANLRQISTMREKLIANASQMSTIEKQNAEQLIAQKQAQNEIVEAQAKRVELAERSQQVEAQALEQQIAANKAASEHNAQSIGMQSRVEALAALPPGTTNPAYHEAVVNRANELLQFDIDNGGTGAGAVEALKTKLAEVRTEIESTKAELQGIFTSGQPIDQTQVNDLRDKLISLKMDGENVQIALNAIQGIPSSANESARQFMQTLDKLSVSSEKAHSASDAFKEWGKQLDDSKDKAQAVATVIEELQEALSAGHFEGGAADIIKKGLEDAGQAGTTTTEKVNILKQALTDAGKEADTVAQKLDTQIAQKINGVGGGQGFAQRLNEYSSTVGGNAADRRDIEGRNKGSMSPIDAQGLQHTYKATEALTQLGSSLMSVTSTLTAFSTGWNTIFNDKNATTVQKITAAIGMLTSTIFLLNNLSKLSATTLGLITQWRIKHAAATAASTAAETAHTSATTANTAAAAANAAAWNAHPIMLLITVALTAAIAIFGALTAAAEANTKKLKENAEASQEVANKAREEASAHQELIAAYNQAKAAYDGTVESKKALEDAALAVAEAYEIENAQLLIAQGRYEDLAKLIDGASLQEKQNVLNTQAQAYRDKLAEIQGTVGEIETGQVALGQSLMQYDETSLMGQFNLQSDADKLASDAAQVVTTLDLVVTNTGQTLQDAFNESQVTEAATELVTVLDDTLTQTGETLAVAAEEGLKDVKTTATQGMTGVTQQWEQQMGVAEAAVANSHLAETAVEGMESMTTETAAQFDDGVSAVTNSNIGEHLTVKAEEFIGNLGNELTDATTNIASDGTNYTQVLTDSAGNVIGALGEEINGAATIVASSNGMTLIVDEAGNFYTIMENGMIEAGNAFTDRIPELADAASGFIATMTNSLTGLQKWWRGDYSDKMIEAGNKGLELYHADTSHTRTTFDIAREASGMGNISELDFMLNFMSYINHNSGEKISTMVSGNEDIMTRMFGTADYGELDLSYITSTWDNLINFISAMGIELSDATKIALQQLYDVNGDLKAAILPENRSSNYDVAADAWSKSGKTGVIQTAYGEEFDLGTYQGVNQTQWQGSEQHGPQNWVNYTGLQEGDLTIDPDTGLPAKVVIDTEWLNSQDPGTQFLIDGQKTLPLILQPMVDYSNLTAFDKEQYGMFFAASTDVSKEREIPVGFTPTSLGGFTSRDTVQLGMVPGTWNGSERAAAIHNNSYVDSTTGAIITGEGTSTGRYVSAKGGQLNLQFNHEPGIEGPGDISFSYELRDDGLYLISSDGQEENIYAITPGSADFNSGAAKTALEDAINTRLASQGISGQVQFAHSPFDASGLQTRSTIATYVGNDMAWRGVEGAPIKADNTLDIDALLSYSEQHKNDFSTSQYYAFLDDLMDAAQNSGIGAFVDSNGSFKHGLYTELLRPTGEYDQRFAATGDTTGRILTAFEQDQGFGVVSDDRGGHRVYREEDIERDAQGNITGVIEGAKAIYEAFDILGNAADLGVKAGKNVTNSDLADMGSFKTATGTQQYLSVGQNGQVQLNLPENATGTDAAAALEAITKYNSSGLGAQVDLASGIGAQIAEWAKLGTITDNLVAAAKDFAFATELSERNSELTLSSIQGIRDETAEGAKDALRDLRFTEDEISQIDPKLLEMSDSDVVKLLRENGYDELATAYEVTLELKDETARQEVRELYDQLTEVEKTYFVQIRFDLLGKDALEDAKQLIVDMQDLAAGRNIDAAYENAQGASAAWTKARKSGKLTDMRAFESDSGIQWGQEIKELHDTSYENIVTFNQFLAMTEQQQLDYLNGMAQAYGEVYDNIKDKASVAADDTARIYGKKLQEINYRTSKTDNKLLGEIQNSQFKDAALQQRAAQATSADRFNLDGQEYARLLDADGKVIHLKLNVDTGKWEEVVDQVEQDNINAQVQCDVGEAEEQVAGFKAEAENYRIDLIVHAQIERSEVDNFINEMTSKKIEIGATISADNLDEMRTILGNQYDSWMAEHGYFDSRTGDYTFTSSHSDADFHDAARQYYDRFLGSRASEAWGTQQATAGRDKFGSSERWLDGTWSGREFTSTDGHSGAYVTEGTQQQVMTDQARFLQGQMGSESGIADSMFDAQGNFQATTENVAALNAALAAFNATAATAAQQLAAISDAGELMNLKQNGDYQGSDQEYEAQMHTARTKENQSTYGMSDDDIKQWEKFAEAVKEGQVQLKNTDGSFIDLKDVSDDVIDELTRSIKRYDKGLIAVNKNQKDWEAMLKAGSSQEFAENIDAVAQAYGDILDIDPSSLSSDFLQSAENMKLLGEAAQGSEDAYNQLAEAASKDIVVHAGGNFDEFKAGIDSAKAALDQPWEDIEVGASLDDADFLNALTEMVRAAGMTAQQAEDALMGMGIDAEVVEDTGETTDTKEDVGFSEHVTATQIPGEVTVPQDGGGAPVSYPTTMVQYTKTIEPDVQSEDETKTTTATGIKVIGAHKAAGGGVKHTNSSTGGGGRRGRGSGGGGGGGGRRQDYTGDRKRKEKRYVTNTNQLEDIQNKLDKINKAESRSYGRNRIKQMQDKAKALKELAAKQHDLYEEAVKYQAQDKKDLQNNDLAKKMGIKFEFDENGTILNRDDIEQKMIDFYNSYTNGKDEKGNWLLKDNSEAGQKAFKEMQEQYEDLEKLLDKYDESQDKVKEYWKTYMDNINEAYDVIVEMANYKVEVQVEVSDEAVQLLDHMLTKIEDDAYKAAEAISYMGQQAFEYQAQDKINNKGIHDILAHHDGKSKYFDSEGKEHTTTKLTEKDIQGIMNGDSAAWDKLMGMEKEFTQDELDSLQEMINSKIEATEKLMETQKQVYAQIGVVFDEATDKMERQMNRIEHLQNITDSYANITDLVGRKKLGMTNEMLNELDLARVDQSLSKLRGAKELMDTQKNMMGTLQNQFVQNADGTWSNNLKATYKDKDGKEVSRQEYWKQQAADLRKQGITTGTASKSDIKADKNNLKDLKADKKAQDAEYKQQLKDLQAQKKALDSELSKATKAEAAADKATSVSGLNKLNYFSSGGIVKTLQGAKLLDSAAIFSGKKKDDSGSNRTETTDKLSRSSKDIQKELKAVEDQIKNTEEAQKKYDETQQKSIDAAQAKLDKDQQEATLMQEKLELYDKLANSESVQLTERDIGLLTDQMEHMEDAIQESTENFYSSWEEAIEKISELYTNMIGRAIEDASDQLAGKLGSLDELADRFAKSQELDERYVADYEKIYEFSKLNRDILNSIDETDNVKAKQALAEYQKEINQLEEDETEISKYQIENARRRYELLLAQLALEEARDAKSQVQMTRSSTGEWSYVYTADDSAVAEAEQNYEDKLFAMQQANADYINELQQNIVDLQQRMIEEIQALRVEDYASYEEYMEAVNAIKEHYGVLMDYNMEQLGIVFGEQTRLYNEDWAAYSEKTGYKISSDEKYIDNWNETALKKQTGFDTMQDMHENFNKVSDQLLEKSSEAYKTWEGLIETAMVDAGTSTDDYATQLNTDVGQMTADAAEAANAMTELGDAAEEAFSRMTEALSNWQAEYSAAIEDMLEKNEALAKSFNELLKAWSGYNDTVGQETGDEGGGDEDTPTGGDDTPTGGGGDTPTGGGGNGSGYAVIDKNYRYYIYEEDGSNTGKSDTHWGFGSKSKDRTYNLSRKIHAGGKDLYELADHPGKFLSGPSAKHKHIYWNEGGSRPSSVPTRPRRPKKRRHHHSRPSRPSRPSSGGSNLRDRGYPSSTDGYRPRPSGGCFETGTQILMADLTTKNIEDIKINDMVMAYNEELMTYEPCAVIESYTHHNTPALMEVYLNDGSVIKMTPAHPILTIEGWKSRDVNMSLWEHRMYVDYLTLEDKIIGHNGFYSIVEIREYALPDNYDTYNLAVDKCHTFIADNIVVHNTVSKYASGGYTGDWGTSDGRIAILHEKEIVLNKEDTANFLTGIGILRDITNAIDLNALASAGYLANLGSAGSVSTGTLEQEVHITAEFPNATDKESIKEAFNDLINLASQYAGRM